MIKDKEITLLIKSTIDLFPKFDYYPWQMNRNWKLQGLILCYAVNNKESFHTIKDFLDHSQDNLDNIENICMILVATKCDARDICIEYHEGKELADKYEIKFFETSAKENLFVEEVLYELTNQMIAKQELLSKSEIKQSLVPKKEEKEKNIDTGKTCACF